MFAASRYITYNRYWTERSRVMKSADKQEQYEADLQAGRLDGFLKQCLIFTCFEPQNHCRSIIGSDGRFYKNELCFDTLDGKQTIANEKLDDFLRKGYELTEEEKMLFLQWSQILAYVKAHCEEEYHPECYYGLYQINEEINIKVPSLVKFKKDGQPFMDWKYGDLNNLIKDLKEAVRNYYLNNLVDMLFRYEFLK